MKRNRRPTCTRFLSREEIGRLHKALDEATGEDSRQQADLQPGQRVLVRAETVPRGLQATAIEAA
ncbi:MAG: hypothetical protein OYH76_00675 [Defluviicoccus sp.]|nr:hypothetical protein [Defluviicoccus sp.]MDE0274376.1 hypothetical protein [Defluviicoccus sp.]